MPLSLQSPVAGASVGEAETLIRQLVQQAGLTTRWVAASGRRWRVCVAEGPNTEIIQIPVGTQYVVRSSLRGELVRVAQAMKGKPTYFCPTCGSTDITFDGQIRWDQDSGSWTLLETLNSPWCGGCEDTIPEATFGEVGHE